MSYVRRNQKGVFDESDTDFKQNYEYCVDTRPIEREDALPESIRHTDRDIAEIESVVERLVERVVERVEADKVRSICTQCVACGIGSGGSLTMLFINSSSFFIPGKSCER